jgi:branched-subunit amino acid transport protein
MGAVTYLPRLLPLVALADRSLPQGVRDWLGLIPVAILAALLAPSLFVAGPTNSLALGKAELFAAIPTLLVALGTRSLGAAVALGMGSFWLLSRFL